MDTSNCREKKITIVTVCLNASKTIENTIASVLKQDYQNIEYIVIDGKSKDGTVNIIKKYTDKIAHFVSEQDKGIYDAMNKGIKMATGEAIYFLNADDRLHDETVISYIMKEFNANPDADIIYGKVVPTCVPDSLPFHIHEYRIITNKYDFLKYGINHQSIFAKRYLFEKTGCFDLNYKVFADFDWLLTAWDKSAKLLFVDRYISYYYYQGFSFAGKRSRNERASAIHRHFPFYVYVFYMIRYVLLRRLKAEATIAVERMISSLSSRV